MRYYFKLSLVLLLALTFILGWPVKSEAAALSALSDVQTRVAKSTASSHDISFTLDGSTTLDAGETVAIDFHEDDGDFTVAGASTAVADLGFNDGTERTILNVGGACSDGANNMIADVNDSTGVLTFTACTGFTSSSSGATINVEYGTAAGGTNRVTNPAAAASYIINITAAGDTGAVASAIVDDDQVVVSTTIDPYLTFQVNQNTVSLTTSGGANPDYANTGFNNGAANTLVANTNAGSGYSISYNGSTLTGPAGTIDAMAAKAASSTNTEQFGINLKDNATPNTGADPSGGSGTAESDYNTADQFKFVADTTTPLASAAGPTGSTTFTVSYIVNITQTTEAGAYSTTLTYICTATF